jgi:hypothetical protein
MLSVVMLSVVMLSAIMLNVVAPKKSKTIFVKLSCVKLCLCNSKNRTNLVPFRK